MTPMMLSALGAVVLVVLWSLSLTKLTVARIVSVMALAVSLHLAVSGQMFERDADLMAPVTIEGLDASGDPVHIDVVLKGEGREPRTVRRIPVTTSIAAGPWTVVLLMVVGFLGLFAVRRDDSRLELLALGAVGVGALIILGVAINVPSGGAGTEWVRDYLAMTLSAERVESFRPPTGGWVYPTWGIQTAVLLLVIVVSTWLPRLPKDHPALEPTLVIASLCVLGALAWNAGALGGFVWGGQDGALCVQAVGAATGIALTASPGGRGLVFGLVAVMAVAGLSG